LLSDTVTFSSRKKALAAEKILAEQPQIAKWWVSLSECKKCKTCGVEIQFAGENAFRTGGTSGGWKFLFGEWAELDENVMPLLLYVCPKCGKVEFYANKKIRQRLINQTQ
jgi:predicted RNA-binding Zn-ribbon protein involved in translation (DUF1610 family)